MPSLVMITAPSTTLVTLAEAKRHVRVDHADDDAYLEALIDVACAHIDGPEPAWLGKAIVEQAWQLRLDEFPSACGGKIVLPLPPLMEVTEVEYVDVDGDEQTVADFRTFGTDAANAAGYILPAFDEDWPETRDEPEAVRVTFTAGHSGGVPKVAKHAALLLIGQWYENRESAAEIDLKEMPNGVDALLEPLRFWPSN